MLLCINFTIKFNNKYQEENINILVINYELDKRYSDSCLVNHDNISIPCIFCKELKEIDNEIRMENEINIEAEKEVNNYNSLISELDDKINIKLSELITIREKNLENLSKIQRLNLELKNIV